MIQFGGVSLPMLTPEIETIIAESFDVENWRPFPERGILSTPPGWLQFPTYNPPVPKIGELTWPADIHAWATAFFLIDNAGLEELQADGGAKHAVNHTAISYSTNKKLNAFFLLRIDDGSNSSTDEEGIAARRFECWMKIAATHRVSEHLYLLALTDERYYWQNNRADSDLPSPNLYTTPGTDTSFAVADAVPILSGKLVVDAVPSIYGGLNPSLWNQWNDRRFSWLAFYLNLAEMYGGRWVCTPRVVDSQTDWPTKLQMVRPTDTYADDNAAFDENVHHLAYGGKAEPQTVFSGWRYIRLMRYGADGHGVSGEATIGAPLEKKYQLSDLTAVSGLPTTYTDNASPGGGPQILGVPVCAERGISSGDWNSRTLQSAKDHAAWLIPFPCSTFIGVVNYPLIGTVQSLVFAVHNSSSGMEAIQTLVNRYANGIPQWYSSPSPEREIRLLQMDGPDFDTGLPLHNALVCNIYSEIDNESPNQYPYYALGEVVKVMPPLGRAAAGSGVQQIIRSGTKYSAVARRVGTTSDGVPIFTHDQQPVIPFMPSLDEGILNSDWDPSLSSISVASGSSQYYIGPEYWLPLGHTSEASVADYEYMWKVFLQIQGAITCGSDDNLSFLITCGIQRPSGGSYASLTGGTDGFPIASGSQCVILGTGVSLVWNGTNNDRTPINTYSKIFTGESEIFSPTANQPDKLATAVWRFGKHAYFDVIPGTYSSSTDARPSTSNADDVGVRFRPWIYIAVSAIPSTISSTDDSTLLGGSFFGQSGGTITDVSPGFSAKLFGLRCDGTHHEFIPP